MSAKNVRQTSRRGRLLVWLLFAAVISWWGCSALFPGADRSSPDLSISATPWPQADRLFRSDRHWLGGDGASSVDLGDERVLWLFGDSFIAPGENRDRRNSSVVRNSLAIQHGYDPAAASITFYWGGGDEQPDAFFTAEAGSWLWPGCGVRAGSVLLIFLMEIQPGRNELGFEPAGWTVVLIDNPDSPPPEWHLAWPEIPRNDSGVVIGSASALIADGYLYAFGARSPGLDVYLVRWKVADVARGDLLQMEWWTGSQGRWEAGGAPAKTPTPVFTRGQMEFTVHYDDAARCFVQIQTVSLTDPRLAFRSAPRITGPWSAPEPFYSPAEMADAELLVYAGKAHKGLAGADIVLTYAVNSLNPERLLGGDTIYYPVVLQGRVLQER